MAYAVVHDIACSWSEYERASRGLLEPLPPGLMVHVAGPTDEGVRLIDIWSGEQPDVDVDTERLTSVVAAVAGRAHARGFRPVHVLVGGSTRSVLNQPAGKERDDAKR